MKVVIIEDETRAAKFLERMLLSARSGIEIVAKIPSVAEGLEFFQDNVNFDVVLSDIQLGDGLSFEIFENLDIDHHVIFTTAYDQYAIEAFKNNGIDYLLKPIDPSDLVKALDKAEKMAAKSQPDIWEALSKIVQSGTSFKKRFLVQVGAKLKVVETGQIAAFYSLQKGTYVFTKDRRSYALDSTLETISSQINPDDFYRVNRSTIVALDAEKEIVQWSTSRLKIELPGLEEIEIIVARERTKEFKRWLDQ